jgi:hypothetical protein
VEFVVAIPVGAGRVEADRVADLLAALRAHEPLVERVVVVDDEPGRAHDGATVVPNPRAGRGIGILGGTCAATLTALRWVQHNAPGATCVRVDTDALVIGPFARSLEEALARHPRAGVFGSCDKTCNGDPRDVAAWGRAVLKHRPPVWVWRRPPRRRHDIQLAVGGRLGAVRRELRAALRNGYRPGEHCIAAACAVTAPMITAMAGAGMLDDSLRWLNTRIGDDIMLGIHARALGLDLVGLVGPGEPFGLRYIGLADTPQRLLDRGFSFIHSLKNDPRLEEAEIRRFFAERRPSP